ncbi:NUDIX hydrolase [Pseudalkalibacillus berkeleyi]|nr:NUDIX domain-containing protein [Pseudalkalibacillus berkeleyi]
MSALIQAFVFINKANRREVVMDYIKYLRNMVGTSKVILVSAGVFVFDQYDRVLLHQRSDNGYWGIPGGFMELGESIEDTARREVFEETGITLRHLRLFKIYSGPHWDQVLDNGDELSGVIAIFTCGDFSGVLKLNEESLNACFFPLAALPQNLFPIQRQMFQDLLLYKHIL